MSRLRKDRLQQHSTPGVLPYDQVESVTLVDAKWTQSVQTPNPVALTEFPGRIWPLLVVFKATDRGMTQEVMICRVKMFCCWWSLKPTVSPVITLAIHTFVKWAFHFSYVLFVATAARDQIHNILCCAVCVLSQSFSGPRRWLHSASRGHHFAALTSFSATGSTFTILVVIIRVWYESCSYQEIKKAFGTSESHNWFVLVNILQLIWWLDDGPIFVYNIPDLG